MIANILEKITLLLLLFIWGFVAIEFKNLPETIPTHFDLQGNADGFGKKNFLWMLPIISTFLCVLLFYVSKNPDSPFLNVSQKMKENKKMTRFFISIIAFLCILCFASLTYSTVLVAKGEKIGLDHSVEILLGLMFCTILVFTFFMKKLLIFFKL